MRIRLRAILTLVAKSSLILIIYFVLLKLLPYLPFHWFYYSGVGRYVDGMCVTHLSLMRCACCVSV